MPMKATTVNISFVIVEPFQLKDRGCASLPSRRAAGPKQLEKNRLIAAAGLPARIAEATARHTTARRLIRRRGGLIGIRAIRLTRACPGRWGRRPPHAWHSRPPR